MADTENPKLKTYADSHMDYTTAKTENPKVERADSKNSTTVNDQPSQQNTNRLASNTERRQQNHNHGDGDCGIFNGGRGFFDGDHGFFDAAARETFEEIFPDLSNLNRLFDPTIEACPAEASGDQRAQQPRRDLHDEDSDHSSSEGHREAIHEFDDEGLHNFASHVILDHPEISEVFHRIGREELFMDLIVSVP
jgi:hypothetical protein